MAKKFMFCVAPFVFFFFHFAILLEDGENVKIMLKAGEEFSISSLFSALNEIAINKLNE